MSDATAQSRLIRKVAHDLNNSITITIGHTEEVLEMMTPLHPAHSALCTIAAVAQRDMQLSHRLVAIAENLEKEKHEPNPTNQNSE